MSNHEMKPLRSWREIAKQAAEELDPNNVLQLAEELIRALDRESRKRVDGVKVKEEPGAA